MSLIRRPLTGGNALGTPFAIAAAPGTTIHAFDQTGTGLGGPFPQRITLWAENPTAGPLDLVLTINGATVGITFAAKAVVQIFDSQPMIASAASGAGAVISGTGSAGGLVCWGFVETQT